MKTKTIVFLLALLLIVFAGCNNAPPNEDKPQPFSFSESVQSTSESEAPAGKESKEVETTPEAVQESEPEKQEEMDIDEFVQYACDYASGIDCSISGKSMLALYERVEMMDEDGVPLTKANAEDLIEEAADRAEKPGLLKRITGAFSSKYDKEGLLILKEEHFI